MREPRSLRASVCGSRTITKVRSMQAGCARSRLHESDLAPMIDVVDSSELVIVCVKPQVVASVLPRLRVDASKVVVSIVAGTGMATFEGALGAHVRLVRVMPNTPMLSRQGACGLVGNAAAVQHGDVELVAQVFTVCAPVVEFLQHEDQINAVTAVSGSGPAYIFRMYATTLAMAMAMAMAYDSGRRRVDAGWRP